MLRIAYFLFRKQRQVATLLPLRNTQYAIRTRHPHLPFYTEPPMIDLTHRYQILETDLGPMISESRTSVYDVLEAQEEGADLYEICQIYNLTPLQVRTALDYIALHRDRLLPELHEIQRIQAERKAYYDAIAAKIQAEIDASPMTPERQKFYELLAQKRAERAQRNGNGHTS